MYLAGEWAEVRAKAVAQWARDVQWRVASRTEPNEKPQLQGHGLMIFGPVGTGKSTAAALCCKAAAEHGRSVRWSYLPDLVDRLTTSAKAREHEVRMQEAIDLLVWDDLGVRDLADWEIGYLDQIVESRYRLRRPMIVTTNWTREDLNADDRLTRMVDRWRERVASRGAVLAGESRRKREAE